MDTVPADGLLAASWLLIALPLAGAAVLLLGGRRTDRWGHLLGTGTVVAAFVLGLLCTFALDGRQVDVDLFTFAATGSLDVQAGLLYDPLSAVFVLLITGVGALIHVYSIGYMAHDPRRRRFFAYLNLFIAAMLLLVLADNFVALYVGWEGVGLASYLLIAFWHERPSAATAAKKAFIMNRVGDVGLALAIFVMFAQLGTVTFEGVFGSVGVLAGGTVTAIGLLLLLGACGKSGQFPLQAWLPDAMEGPTPVSALIHAATMVTAGVYLIARSAPIYDQTPTARAVVLAVGAVTLMIGAIAGCAQDDIKKVLAYSTVSQIGYMFLAVGLGPAGYVAALAHLLTHGFFKAGLFLGAGSVMHAMNDSVDMRRYGGLASKMKVTFVTFGLGYLALIGFPFLSGFYSKDAIIEAAFDRGDGWGYVLGAVAILAAGLTAFYMTRLMLLTFGGRPRWEDGVHPHESPSVMTVPMIVLAVGSVLAGFLLVVAFPLEEWLAPVFGEPEGAEHVVAPLVVSVLVTLVMVLGAGTAWLFVGRREVPLTAPVRVSPVVRAARRALYADTVNESLFMRPGQWLTRALVFVDNRGVDGAVNGLAATLGGSSSRLGRAQTGFVRSYALSMLGGAVVVAGALLAVTAG
ncbi:NADH-quinone oxidoreductase subunit L [Geodermatophilus sabuli]|uniref:NADH dehydrogenase subunit L n=1 Tax=Geodermatophilus sabuli TaxID=1564158 RepID=A0A285EC47_9ACTN|nr:NADH-quinone oxidoreductase subunit L [Geodermatophilus sabuli]MBB3084961.1 NADH-quinone oxidoreductase subunit L [Geodermatophilus sabuli]SNX95631.1 NADH dehydrogenase subunit L [Geodermatophilus sabuli]